MKAEVDDDTVGWIYRWSIAGIINKPYIKLNKFIYIFFFNTEPRPINPEHIPAKNPEVIIIKKDFGLKYLSSI